MQALIGSSAVKRLEERSHFALPAFVHVARAHVSKRRFEIVRLRVADQEAIRVQEQRVIAPPGLSQRTHFGPDSLVAALVFLEPFRLHLEQKANAFHYLFQSSHTGCRTGGWRRNASVNTPRARAKARPMPVRAL